MYALDHVPMHYNNYSYKYTNTNNTPHIQQTVKVEVNDVGRNEKQSLHDYQKKNKFHKHKRSITMLQRKLTLYKRTIIAVMTVMMIDRQKDVMTK